MSINGMRIKRKLEARQREGTRVTFYVSQDVLEAFKAHCGSLKPSAVVNELLKEYVASTPGKFQTKYKRLSQAD